MFGLKIFNQAGDALGPVPPQAGSAQSPLAESIAHALRSGTGLTDVLGAPVDARRAAGYAVAYRSITLIAGSLAILPAYIEDSDGYVVDDIELITDIGDRSAARVLFGDEPISGVFSGTPDLIKQCGADMAVSGNFYLSKVLGPGGLLSGLEYHSPNGARSTIHRFENGQLFLSYQLPELGLSTGRKLQAASRDVVHAKLPRVGAITNQSGVCGTAPLRACERPLGIANFAHDFQVDYYRSGGFGNQAIISLAGMLDAKQAQEIEERLHRKVDPNREGRRAFSVIGGGGSGRDPGTASVTSLTTDTQSAEMLKHASAAEEEVARAFGIPGSLIGIKEITRTQAGLEELTKTFIRFCLAHYRQALENAITTSLFSNRGGLKFKLDTSKFTAADLSTVAEFVMATQGDAQRPAVLSFPEVRESVLADIPRRRSTEKAPITFTPAASPALQTNEPD